jgi:hypothetical protein
MAKENTAIFVISNPHIFHYKKIVKKWIKREKNYLRYSSLFDYLYNEDRLEILRSGNFTSFRHPILAKIFSVDLFNNLEFFIWMCINRLLGKKIKIYKNLNDIDFRNRVIFDFAATWNLGDRNHLPKLLTFKGITLIHMTHYFKNSSLIFDLLPQFQHPVLVSEGNIMENDFFKINIKKKVVEINVPFVIDHLDKQILEKSESISRNKKCLIMGSPNLYHYNIELLDFYNTDFLNPDRTNFRKLATANEKFVFEPSNKTESVHNFKKSLKELYCGTSLFFTGSEIIGLPSINTFEGMYFGALYIGPKDQVHESLGFVDRMNYLSYTPGDYSDFTKVVDFALSNPILTSRISNQGQKFVIENFNGQNVFGTLVKKIDELLMAKNLKF